MAQPTAIVPDHGIRPGLNETGTTIAKALVVKRVAGTQADSVALPDAGGPALGVTMQAVLDDERGDVQVEGMGIVTSGAAFARGVELTPTATGKLIAAVVNDYVFAISRSEALGADQEVEAELVGPNSGRVIIGP
jgi:CubicO group peptidase (beta-lactamase class C family)